MKKRPIKLIIALIATISTTHTAMSSQAATPYQMMSSLQQTVGGIQAAAQPVMQNFMQLQAGSLKPDATAHSVAQAFNNAINVAKSHYATLTTQAEKDLFFASLLQQTNLIFTQHVPSTITLELINGLKNGILSYAQFGTNFIHGFIQGLVNTLSSGLDSAVSILYSNSTPKS